MRISLPVIALALAAFQAQAQTPPTTVSPAPATPPPATVAPMPSDTTASPTATPPATHARTHTRKSLQERFDAANKTHDGHLTMEQAKSGMPSVAKNFAAIDKDKSGYVTMDEIHTYNSARRAHSKAAKHPS